MPNSLNFFAVFGPKNGDFETQKRYVRPTQNSLFSDAAVAVHNLTVGFVSWRIYDSSCVVGWQVTGLIYSELRSGSRFEGLRLKLTPIS